VRKRAERKKVQMSGPSPALTKKRHKRSRWANAFSFVNSQTRPTCWLSLAFQLKANPIF